VGVIEALDQVCVAGAGAASAYREPSGQLGLGGGREGAGLLVVHVERVDAALASDGVDNGLQAVADDPVKALDAGNGGDLHELLGGFHSDLLPAAERADGWNDTSMGEPGVAG
jgi:hypothetical protein